ncbi:hypothetical protein AAF712_012113 [Marasmius tenuissimus]|uniref:Cytochrome P450 n=1 Tax=Marasmius tenuissimus TaxID=585030 RepID=A0ABR2ZJH9_9AGAR
MSPGLRRTLIDYAPLPDLRLARDLVDILDGTTKAILAKKKEGLRLGDSVIKEQIGQGKDFTSLLMKAYDSEDGQMTEEELLGQMNVILFAGVDTTSTTVARCLQELSKNHDIQGRLRAEIDNASVDGDLDYETLCNLPLLDAVARETLRMYPAAITSSREALKDSVLPLSKPMTGVDGTPITEVFVPKGTVVHIGVRAANQDRTVWGEDAAEWKPERWLKPLPDEVVNSKIPGVHPKLMSFIGGPRGCIGYKFAEISMKVLLAVLIQNFEFSPSEAEIVWKLGQAEAPTVNGKQAMPIIVTARAPL